MLFSALRKETQPLTKLSLSYKAPTFARSNLTEFKKTSMTKNLFTLAGLCILPALTFAQTTETFESVTQSGNFKPTTFVSNGQSFTLLTNDCINGGIFGVWIPNQTITYCNSSTSSNLNVSNYGVGTSCTGGTCTGTSAKFIDNSNSNGVNQIYTIKTTNSALFTIKSMFVFLSSDHAATPSAAGGITVTGKVAGNPVFTYTKTTGFNTGFAANNGFTYLDFSSGTNYTQTNIDELQIQGGNIANYVAVDNFRWGASVALPLGLLSFDVKQNNGNVFLNWNTINEANFVRFQIERSADGKSFAALGNVTADKSGTYSFIDNAPLSGNNFYRLAMFSKNGDVEYSDVKNTVVKIKQQANRLIYPNPVRDVLYAEIQDAGIWQIQITDFTGRVVAAAKLSATSNSLSLGHLKSGVYFYKAVNTETNAVVAQGKVTKL